MTKKGLRILSIMSVAAAVVACVVATVGMVSIHNDSAKFDHGLKQAKARCASLHGVWMPDNLHKGYDHYLDGPGYCVQPHSIYFGYPDLARTP